MSPENCPRASSQERAAVRGLFAADDARSVTLVSLGSCRDRDGRCLL